MNRTLIILLAALESFLAVALGVGISLVPLTLMWAVTPDLDVGWLVYWRASADIWLVGHGVDLAITLDPAFASSLALPGAEKPFMVSIAPLSFALLTALLGVRVGRKSFDSGARFIGPVSAIGAFGALTVLVALSAINANAMPKMWMAVSFPTLIYALGMFIGARGEVGHSGGRTEKVQQKVRGWALGLSTQVKAVLGFSIRGALMAVAAIATVSAVTLAVLLVVNFSTVLGIYEGLQGGGGGSLILTAAQLMFMPNFVLWVFAWFVGTGFAIGTGSLVSPLGTDLGLVPALPVLGAIPPGQMAFGLLSVLVPIAASFTAAFFSWPALSRRLGTHQRFRWLALSAVSFAFVGGLVTFALMWMSAGSAGPGRLVNVGPVAWLTALVLAGEFVVAGTLGMWAASQTNFSFTGAKKSAQTSR